MMGITTFNPSYKSRCYPITVRRRGPKTPARVPSSRPSDRSPPWRGRGSRGRCEKPLVQHLTTAEGAAGGVPRQAEQLHPIARRGVVGGEVLLDLRAKWAGKILFARLD